MSEVNCEQSCNWLESGKMAIGSGTKRALKSVQDSSAKKFLAMRSCLKTTTVYPQKKKPISNAVLCDLQCLHPLARKQSTGRGTVAFVAKVSLKMSSLQFAPGYYMAVIIMVIGTTMFIVLSLWLRDFKSSPGSLDECRTALSGCRPSDQWSWASSLLPWIGTGSSYAVIYHQSTSCYSFYCPTEKQKAESAWVAGYIPRWFNSPWTVTHSNIH